MAIPVNIHDLINRTVVESTRIEFKADYNPAPIIRTLCAFANDIDNMGGGYIVIGVEEKDGVPVLPVKGIAPAQVDGILKKLLQHCRCITPAYLPVAEPFLIDGRYVIVVWATAGFGRPYKAPKDVLAPSAEYHYYIRKFSSTIAAQAGDERDLFYISSNVPFDDRPCLPAPIDCLSKELLVEHLAAIQSDLLRDAGERSVQALAQDMQLLSFAWERQVPRNVAVLMFSEDPEKYLPGARIEFVDKPTPSGERMKEKYFRGPLQHQLTQALEFLKNHVIQTLIVKHPDRAEADHVYNYPYQALEELVSNAVYHKAYDIREPVTIELTPERLTISSLPGLDLSITDEAIAKLQIHSRLYRNRRIGDFLKELHLIEGRNTGFPNAIKALEANGSPMLEIHMDPGRHYVDVVLPIHPAFLTKKSGRPADPTLNRRLLAALSERPMTLTELAAALGYKGISAKLRNQVQMLADAGKIERRVTAGNRRLLSLAVPETR